LKLWPRRLRKANDIVISRILIKSVLLTLVAFAGWAGPPAHGAGAISAASSDQAVGASSIPAARRALREQKDDSDLIQRIEDQDDPDRTVRMASPICWPTTAAGTHYSPAGPETVRTHRACASPPRGPPHV
jgi:hypothetical protein